MVLDKEAGLKTDELKEKLLRSRNALFTLFHLDVVEKIRELRDEVNLN